MEEPAPKTSHIQKSSADKGENLGEGPNLSPPDTKKEDNLPRPSWETAPYTWWPASEDKKGLSREVVEHWRREMIGKRWVMYDGDTYAMINAAWRRRDAVKRLEKGQLEGWESEVTNARKELDELDEIERRELAAPPEWDFNEKNLPQDLKYAIAGTVSDDVQLDRLTIVIDDDETPLRRGIITNVGRG